MSVIDEMMGIREFTGVGSMGTVTADVVPVGVPAAAQCKHEFVDGVCKHCRKRKSTVEGIIGDEPKSVSIIPPKSEPVMKVGEPAPIEQADKPAPAAAEGKPDAMDVLLGTDSSTPKAPAAPDLQPAASFESLIRLHAASFNATAARITAKPPEAIKESTGGKFGIESEIFQKLNKVELPEAKAEDKPAVVQALESASTLAPLNPSNPLGQGVPMPEPVHRDNSAKIMGAFRKFSGV